METTKNPPGDAKHCDGCNCDGEIHCDGCLCFGDPIDLHDDCGVDADLVQEWFDRKRLLYGLEEQAIHILEELIHDIRHGL